ncbi:MULTISPECIES: 5'-methylthioadenosine/S-adenosylhomocysteine nucleosidase [Corallincola]|uniref:5'-methylthioadenosine/S-adenosylhomocysteine nucleosidase n=3 Tax=Corallincola TaxID=1775176 RepID=A0A368NP44_9GAMM|nr:MULTISPECIES: 5'-methylthioadenosine/S-adenosylhomocysteine nucleosidase [Corallincola]RCU51635.1 5'-methylthioadenosine/S-adenosylhomocysteine nucleosidase [Corallincola holothuriorum]TAA47136.1 5'-methylthioadenosine/S-adenosylhomocysteine nucleosidase [Corallincola spongiicola]TCI04793.1 5'-methylthioadenosine/S-adenosylhomocysteine nucleosidase [Corallincola luteus]
MKIGIIGAMDQEVTQLRSQLTPSDNVIKDAGIEFYPGELHGHEVILLKSGIGKVAAAISTTLLLERFAPDIVINIGSAGGFDPALQVGDVVISSEVRYHDVDVTAFNYEPGQLPGQPAAFTPAADLVALAEQSLNAVGEAKAVKGLICSGDIFMADPARVEQARALFPTMAACEMEAAAVAHVCHQFSVPFVIIRALSDIAGKSSHLSFEQFLDKAAHHSSLVVADMLKRLA